MCETRGVRTCETRGVCAHETRGVCECVRRVQVRSHQLRLYQLRRRGLAGQGIAPPQQLQRRPSPPDDRHNPGGVHSAALRDARHAH